MDILRVLAGTIYLAVIIFAAAPADARLKECGPLNADGVAALAAAERGLRDAGTDLQKRGRMLSCRGIALEDLGRLADADRDYVEARDIARQLDDRELLAETLVQHGYVQYYNGEHAAALPELQLAYRINTEMRRPEGRRHALEAMAHIYADSKVGQFDTAIEYYLQLLPEFEASGAATDAADTLFNLGSTHDRKGNYEEALRWYNRALVAERRLGRADDVASIHRSMGVTLSQMGRGTEAMEFFDKAIGYHRRAGSEEGMAQVRQSRGIANRRLGRLPQAIADLEASRNHFARNRNARFEEKSQDELAIAYAAAGRWREAFEARTAHEKLQLDLATKQREDQTSRLRVQFDTAKKEQENRDLLRIRRLQNIVLALSAAVMLALIGLVVRHFSMARRMRVLAMTDELTRLPNRRHLFATAHDQLQHAQRGGEPFSIVVFDIDHFKRINDTWGHATGDQVLQRVAHACRSAIRPQDAIGRTGGEEFMVVLPDTTATEAARVAERLRVVVEEIDCSDIDPSLRVTISLGVAQRIESEETLTKIAGRADDVLYRAKESGRNRVEIAA
jgi:diguanylate cyclase (GGDEF)-like protein